MKKLTADVCAGLLLTPWPWGAALSHDSSPGGLHAQTLALSLRPDHHDLRAQAVEQDVAEGAHLDGPPGSLRNTRRKVFERLKTYHETLRQTGRDTSYLDRAQMPFSAFPSGVGPAMRWDANCGWTSPTRPWPR